MQIVMFLMLIKMWKKKMPAIYEWLSWALLFALAQWFFGNLYEAAAFVPNATSFIAAKSGEAKALFERKAVSPILYYFVPSAATLLLAPILAIAGWRRHDPGTPYILASCGLVLAAAALTYYVVRYINLDLFFQPQTDLIRTGKLLRTWAILNLIRLSLVAASIVMIVFWIRTIVET
jgi:hypothetical protein